MEFSLAIEKICASSNVPLTPQQIRDCIKVEYPQFYSTPSHLRSVAKGHYKDADHALLAQIYVVVRSGNKFFSDTSQKPMRISLKNRNNFTEAPTVMETAHFTFHHIQVSNYSKKTEDILANATPYHEAYYHSIVFTGPSLYFHQRAIDTSGSPITPTHLEYVYAALTSWGMHRMGPKGSKMIGFEEFCQTIQFLNNEIMFAKNFNIHDMDENKWNILKRIFQGIRVMASSVSLVGNSKVMHHILPNIIPPIDRNYTLRYLHENTIIHPNLDTEWLMMRGLLENFFLPIVSDKSFESIANTWLSRRDVYPWDTSMMKIVDNLIIGALRSS